MEDYNTVPPIPGWAIAHGSTSFPNPLRVRFDGVNSSRQRVRRSTGTFIRDWMTHLNGAILFIESST
jgi:hypothetical protein